MYYRCCRHRRSSRHRFLRCLGGQKRPSTKSYQTLYDKRYRRKSEYQRSQRHDPRIPPRGRYLRHQSLAGVHACLERRHVAMNLSRWLRWKRNTCQFLFLFRHWTLSHYRRSQVACQGGKPARFPNLSEFVNMQAPELFPFDR